MRLSTALLALLTAVPGALSQNSTTGNTTTPTTSFGYGNITPSIPLNNTSFNFGRNYAVLNLDMINGIYGNFNTTPQGQALINATVAWINATQSQTPQPLTIWTRIYFQTSLRPELGVGVPFQRVIGGLGNITESSPQGQIYPAFRPNSARDVIIPKTRLYAGAGNGLEQILASYRIDTVILSGTRTSAVILATALRLFDLNYNVYVIADTVIEPAPDNGIYKTILEGILPKNQLNVITLQQAIGALSRSGPAIE